MNIYSFNALSIGFNLKILTIISIIILVLDYIWMGNIARDLYVKWVKQSQGVSGYSGIAYPLIRNNIPAILAYVSMIVSLSTLVMPRVIDDLKHEQPSIFERLYVSFIWGGLWALGVYGTYQFTNYAISTRRYPISFVVVDVIWGILLGTIATFVGSMVVV